MTTVSALKWLSVALGLLLVLAAFVPVAVTWIERLLLPISTGQGQR